MLSSLSSLSPSQPLMLFVNTSGDWGVATGILTIQSIAVLQTNMVSPALLNSMPLAPNGGTPLLGKSVASGPAQGFAVAGPAPQIDPPFGWKVQMMPANESLKYTLP